MRHSPIFLKLYAGFALVILFSMLIVGLMVQRQIEQASLKDIRNNLSSQAFILQQSFADMDTQSQNEIQQMVQQIGDRIATRVTLLTRDGVVMADSEFRFDEMDNHLSRPEIISATQSRVGESSRFSTTLQKPMLYVAYKSHGQSF